MTPPRIAAIVTCHNLGQTLEAALASVERQTRAAAELVVIDDGSTETCTRQLLDSLQRGGTWVAQAGGRGVSAARNLGAQLTSSEYLVCLDADDILEPTYFESTAARLDADPDLDFVSSALRAFGASSYVWKPAAPRFVEVISTGAYPHASTMMRRRLWQTVGGFDEALPLFELLDFWASVLERGGKGVVLDEPLLNYRMRPDSRYRRMIQTENYVSGLARFYEKHRAAVERHGLDLINGKEAFLQGQRTYHAELKARMASLEAELLEVEREIAQDTPSIAAQAFRPADRATILVYHRIADLTPDSHGLCTPPAVFREHMRSLRQNFCPISLDDLDAATASGRIPERAVAVTLDDGYFDALTTASPILTELGIPATFFVNSDRLDEKHERWWDILERLFSAEVPPFLSMTIGHQELRLQTGTASERAAALTRLNELAWPLSAAAREEMVEKVLVWSGAERRPRDSHRVLTGDELRELADRPGHSIGAHTAHHLALTTQPTETRRREIVENKISLERLLGRPVHLFSYPYGDFDAETIALVSEARFRAAVTVEPGTVSAGTNRLLLPRREVTALEFAV